MRLRTVAKIGVMLSIVLFCIAIGSYEFISLSDTERHRDLNLFALVPQDCASVMVSDNINSIASAYVNVNYQHEINDLQSNSLSGYLLQSLMQFSSGHVHSFSNLMGSVLVCYTDLADPTDEVIYFRTNGEGKGVLKALSATFVKQVDPKKEKYRKETIVIYQLINDRFLATYTGDGFFVVSYHKQLIEKVIDTYLDKNGLDKDLVFAKTQAKKKSHNYVSLYTRSPLLPFIEDGQKVWSDFDIHANSDVIYLAGETYWNNDHTVWDEAQAYLQSIPDIRTDSLALSANHEHIQSFMRKAKEDPGIYPFFSQCLASLSPDASFILVTDMQKVAQNPDLFTPYLSTYVLERASFFSPFILSSQVSLLNDKISHLIVLTYKN